MNSKEHIDYIIVGGGSAGCVLAARLSECGKYRVVLLEAGGKSDGERFQVPGATAFNLGKPNIDWRYQTQPDPTINNRQFDWSAGKVLGGGSAINGLVYIRGTPSDFEQWQQHVGGKTDWSYDAMLPYFKKAESFQDRSESYLGHAGPIGVSGVRDPNPLRAQFLQAGAEAGYAITDLNGPSPDGFGPADSSQRNARRASSYISYIKPNSQRRNLRIITHAEVKRLCIVDGRAQAVEFSLDGRQHKLYADKEIIVCAGAIGSPALLLRSGIGNPENLAKLGIETRHALPGVGQNLQEHSGTGIAKFVNVTTLNSQMGPISGLKHVWHYYRHRRGALSSPIVEAMAFVKTRPELKDPDIQLHFLPFGYIIQPHSRSAITAYKPKQNAMMITITLCKPKTRGTISLNAQGNAIIQHQLFSAPEDMDTLVEGAKLAEHIYQQPALAKHITQPCSPETAMKDDEDWRQYIRARANIGYHFCGSCSMGNDTSSVVDEQLRVHGLQGLRVADASIMPIITSGNTNATVIAIAERAADFILG